MTGWEVLTRELSLPLEWQLGGGGEAIWAPAAPARIDKPGFRDAAYFRGQSIDPLFAITILDGRGRLLQATASSRRWNPARLELKYTLPEALVVERRAALSTDSFVSQLSLTHADEASRDFWLLFWTRRPINKTCQLAELDANPQGISFAESRGNASGEEIARWGCALGTNFDADSWTVDHTTNGGAELDWPSTPLADLMSHAGLPGHFPSVESKDGWLWMALAYPFSIAPGDRLKVSFVAALGTDVESARGNLEHAVGLVDPIHTSEEDWIAWFEEAPSLECSDPFLQRAYWHRMAMRKIWRFARRPWDNQRIPVDGAIETSWRHDEDEVLAAGGKWFSEPAGCVNSPVSILLRRLAAIHPNVEFLTDVASAAPEIVELVARTFAADVGESSSCVAGDSVTATLGNTSLAADLLSSLAAIGREVPGSIDLERTESIAAELRHRLDQDYWCAASGWFLDSRDRSNQNSPRRTIHGLFPLLLDIVEPPARERMLSTLLDPECFRTRLSLPGVSRNEASFQPDAECDPDVAWRSGRVCPHLASLAIESLSHEVEQASPQDRLILADLVLTVARSLFIDGDIDRPASFDHYHPLTGRGTMSIGPAPPKGWLADHLIRLVGGLRPTLEGALIVDPLPFGLAWLKLERVAVGDSEIEVVWENRGGLAVTIDEKPVGHAQVGHAIAVQLPNYPATTQCTSHDAFVV